MVNARVIENPQGGINVVVSSPYTPHTVVQDQSGYFHVAITLVQLSALDRDHYRRRLALSERYSSWLRQAIPFRKYARVERIKEEIASIDQILNAALGRASLSMEMYQGLAGEAMNPLSIRGWFIYSPTGGQLLDIGMFRQRISYSLYIPPPNERFLRGICGARLFTNEMMEAVTLHDCYDLARR